ncbi:hypothetical protein ES703_89662 [subsurface metagenome]
MGHLRPHPGIELDGVQNLGPGLKGQPDHIVAQGLDPYIIATSEGIDYALGAHVAVEDLTTYVLVAALYPEADQGAPRRLSHPGNLPVHQVGVAVHLEGQLYPSPIFPDEIGEPLLFHRQEVVVEDVIRNLGEISGHHLHLFQKACHAAEPDILVVAI